MTTECKDEIWNVRGALGMKTSQLLAKHFPSPLGFCAGTLACCLCLYCLHSTIRVFKVSGSLVATLYVTINFDVYLGQSLYYHYVLIFYHANQFIYQSTKKQCVELDVITEYLRNDDLKKYHR